eukprot:3496203-Lingulodinium_polyedra.AAC.1
MPAVASVAGTPRPDLAVMSSAEMRLHAGLVSHFHWRSAWARRGHREDAHPCIRRGRQDSTTKST